MKKKIITIAEYDGAKNVCHIWNDTWAIGRRPNIEYYGFDQLRVRYACDLNHLHRVALKVYDDMYGVYDLDSRYGEDIQMAMMDSPVGGKYKSLLNSVYNAIIYLQNAERV